MFVYWWQAVSSQGDRMVRCKAVLMAWKIAPNSVSPSGTSSPRAPEWSSLSSLPKSAPVWRGGCRVIEKGGHWSRTAARCRKQTEKIETSPSLALRDSAGEKHSSQVSKCSEKETEGSRPENDFQIYHLNLVWVLMGKRLTSLTLSFLICQVKLISGMPQDNSGCEGQFRKNVHSNR